MERVPADIGDWGLVGIFHESGRLLREYFRVFLPVILCYIFPASLIKVLYYQFLFALHHGPDSESRSLLATLFFTLIFMLPLGMLIEGAKMMFHNLKNVIYDFSGSKLISADGPNWHNAGAFHVFFSRKASMGKKLKALPVGLLWVTVWAAISTTGRQFTHERVAEMGLPAWSIFVFTVLITLLSTATNVYFILVIVMLFIWICSPETPILS